VEGVDFLAKSTYKVIEELMVIEGILNCFGKRVFFGSHLEKYYSFKSCGFLFEVTFRPYSNTI